MHILIWFIKHTRMVYTHGHQHICNTLLKREDKKRRTETAGGKKTKFVVDVRAAPSRPHAASPKHPTWVWRPYCRTYASQTRTDTPHTHI